MTASDGDRRDTRTRHRLVNPDALAPAVGFAHAVVAGPGQTIHLAGQIGQDRAGRLAAGLVAQFDQALGNLAQALAAAGGEPADLVSLLIFVTDVGAYRERLPALGEVWRRHLGRHYPAVALVGVRELFEPAALVEITGTAVVAGAPAG